MKWVVLYKKMILENDFLSQVDTKIIEIPI